MTSTKEAHGAAGRVFKLDARLMEALEESGGEVTPEVEAIEAEWRGSLDRLAEQGAALKKYAQHMQSMVRDRKAELDTVGREYKGMEKVADRLLRLASSEKGETSFDAGEFRVSLSKARVKLVGGLSVNSAGWYDEADVQSSAIGGLADRGLGRWGFKPDRKAILARVKKGETVLDYAAVRPAEKTVVVK